MPIKVECQNCGHLYQVGDAMAGKKVKCKTCSAVIAIPSGDDEFDFSAVEVEAPSESPAKSPMPNRARAAAMRQFEEDANPQTEEEEAGVPETNAALVFPGSEVLESILPIILVAGGLGWMAIQAFHAEDPAHGWVGPFRAAMYLLVYVAVVFPFCIMGVKAAGKKAYFAMPDGYIWRTFATFCPPAAFAAIFTLISPSLVMFCLGLIVELVVSLGAYIFLFNLSANQMGKAVGVVCGYVIGGTVLGAGVMFGLSFLAQAMLSFTKSAHEYPGNPLGPQFAWAVEPQTEEPLKKKNLNALAVAPATQSATTEPVTPTAVPTTQTVESATTQQIATAVNPGPSTMQSASTQTAPMTAVATVATPTPTPPQPAAESLLAEAPAPLPLGAIEDAYFAGQSGGSTVLVLITHANFGDAFELWDGSTDAWKKIGAFNAQPKTSDHGNIVLSASPKGIFMARMVDFPRTSIEVRPISKDPVADLARVRRVDPDALRGASMSLLGFTGQGYIMSMTCGDTGALDVYDPQRTSQGPGSQLARNPIALGGIPSSARCNVAISPDARYLASVRHNAIASAKGVVGNYLVINGVGAGSNLDKLTLTGLQPDKPVAVTGLAFSPDSTRVAMLFQENQDGLIEIYRVPDGKQLASHIFPAGSAGAPITNFHGSALTWLADGNSLLINGRFVKSADDFSDVGDLGIDHVKGQHVVDRENLLLLVSDPATGDKAQVLHVKLDAAKFHAPATKPAAGHVTNIDVPPTVPLR